MLSLDTYTGIDGVTVQAIQYIVPDQEDGQDFIAWATAVIAVKDEIAAQVPAEIQATSYFGTQNTDLLNPVTTQWDISVRNVASQRWDLIHPGDYVVVSPSTSGVPVCLGLAASVLLALFTEAIVSP